MKKECELFKNMVYVFRGVWKYNRLICVLVVINMLVTAVSPFIGIFFPRQILEELLTDKRIERLVWLLLLFFLLSSMTAYFMQYLKGVFMAQPVKVARPYMDLLYRKCMEISFRCTQEPAFLNGVQKAIKGGGQNNYDGISGMLHKWFDLPGAIIALLGYMVIVSRLNVGLLLYLIFGAGVNYFFSLALAGYERSKQDELTGNERRSEYLYKLMYDFSYGKEIRMFGLSDWLSDRFLFYREKIRNIKQSVKSFGMYGVWINVVLSLLREGIVYSYLLFLVIRNTISIADFTMYMVTIAGFGEAFEGVVGHLANMHKLSLQISDYRAFILWEDDMVKAKEPLPIPPGPYEFVFRNVSYRYPGSDSYVFRNLNMTIKGGQKLALVGHNGAGKSTFIKLLLRLYDVTEGEILCNGINIKSFDREQYYALFSPVFQEILPLAFSAADNIGVNEAGRIDRQRVGDCIQKVGLKNKIDSLRYGMDTCVQKMMDDEGIEFSGGEKQRLMIARALYKDGSVMVLDEPTAALDALTEQNFYEDFNRLLGDRTTVYVSHRLASTRFCDVIAFFEKGELAEYGTHEELLRFGGKYANMFRIQATYYMTEEIQ